jgi:hypothetical protein
MNVAMSETDVFLLNNSSVSRCRPQTIAVQSGCSIPILSPKLRNYQRNKTGLHSSPGEGLL